MAKLRIKIVDTVRLLSRTGHTIRSWNRGSGVNPHISRDIKQITRALLEQSKGNLRLKFIVPDKCKVLRLFAVQSYEKEEKDAIEIAFGGPESKITAYITFKAVISPKINDPEVILDDFVYTIFEAVIRKISPGKYTEINISVNFDPSHSSVINAGIMIEGVV